MQKGLYIIENNVNGMKYVGSTKRDLQLRLKEHRGDLKGGYHRNRYLQAAWLKYGEKAFDFRELLPMSFEQNDNIDELLRIAEDAAMAEHNSIAPNGYNLKTAERQLMSEESKRKMSESKKGEKNNFYGKTHSPEVIERSRELNKARRATMTDEQKAEERRKVSEGVRRAKAEGRGSSGWTPESRQKATETKRKRQLTEKERTARSAAAKKMSSLPRSEEQIRKMSEARRAWWANKRNEKKDVNSSCEQPA